MGEEPNHLPTVTLSYAQTLDGRLATAAGSSQWISCESSLARAHALRAGHDAVMVGVGTVCRDDPRLTVRLVPGENPLRVVVDSTLRTPPSAAVLSDGGAGRTVLAVTERASRERCARAERLGARVLRLPEDGEGRVELAALLAALWESGVRSVMVEGGASLITSFLRERLADRLAVCVAPKLLGRGIEAVGELGIRDLGGALRLEETSVTLCGTDILVDGRIRYPDAPSS
ncbi:2,5-diamino-6-(5-phosphoribosylamino)pyrimidin-4(3H)-one reductase [Rubrobacter xylanophilus DSM 9941]|uniref:2, 5-diamino-6-(5-phosphoribosylamino)pyrimidin-4(3H)-one reductase n=1 Tax=Rubrobacter xylanophilus (strain DSM 9941 / JCM 11954 / NBRC 16129 / PRD-1) TaxID=266117 RepID=Q1ASY3_RUBXD|nr:RibD family protein [Rubrobacter xylanophilus]ABG05495.1 2,5-diamino-6-(5-phosphoribosylamino)pyrimidin-4(3H)-one reductase [Rubrobacter xylanophilus DSM 9941]